MTRYRLRRLVALSALPLCLPFAAHAQYDPGATAMLGAGYGFNALSQSTMSNAFRATETDEGGKGKGKADKASAAQGKSAGQRSARNEPVKLKPQYTQADVDRYMKQRQAYHEKRLAPEYHRRVRTDGEASAQRWLKARSHVIGKEEGAKARALFAQN